MYGAPAVCGGVINLLSIKELTFGREAKCPDACITDDFKYLPNHVARLNETKGFQIVHSRS